MLVGIKVVMAQLTVSHATDGVDKVATEEILKPILVRVVSVRMTIELVRWRIGLTLFITSVLRSVQYPCNKGLRKTYTIALLVEHEGSDSPPGVGTKAGLATDTDSGAALAKLILCSRNGTSGHRHGRVSGGEEVEITEVVDGGMTNQWCSLYPFPVRIIAGPERMDHLVSSGSSPTPITEPHHSSVRRANGVTSALHTLSA